MLCAVKDKFLTYGGNEMKSRGKRFFRRLFKVGSVLILIGIGLLIGLAIGTNSTNERQRVIIGPDRSFQMEQQIGEQIERQIEERIVEEIVIPPIPPVPAIPEIPDLSRINTQVHIERTPSFWDVLNGIGTILASLILMGLGGMILIRRWQQPKEKSPESVEV
jgi:hypothetical protein